MASTEILTKLRQIIRSIHMESKRIEKQYAISIPQLLTLQYLAQQVNYQSSARELKEHLQLNASTISGILSRLEQKGLIARLPRFRDKRVAYVALTEKGMTLLEQAPTTLFERLSEALEKLPAEDIASLHQHLDFLVTAMGAQDIDASPILTSHEFPKNPH